MGSTDDEKQKMKWKIHATQRYKEYGKQQVRPTYNPLIFKSVRFEQTDNTLHKDLLSNHLSL